VIRVVHEHPRKINKYLNGGKVKVVMTESCNSSTEKAVVKALKQQYKGRVCDEDLSQIGFFNFKNIDLCWFIQAVLRSDHTTLSDDVFSTKTNTYLLFICSPHELSTFHKHRIQKTIKRKNYE